MKTNKYSFEYEPIPTESNIEYIFQRLIFDVLASSKYELYEETKEEWKGIYQIILKWLDTYVNNKILKIDKNEFKIIEQKLYELDNKYLTSDGLYAEDAYEWILQLQIVLEKIERNGCVNNGL